MIDPRPALARTKPHAAVEAWTWRACAVCGEGCAVVEGAAERRCRACRDKRLPQGEPEAFEPWWTGEGGP